jgi:transcriptional regulator with XRE-family HTH domain
MEKEIFMELIEVSGLTQKEFSQKTGVPESRISEYVNGKRLPKMSNLHEIAEKLDLQIDVLFKVSKMKK